MCTIADERSAFISEADTVWSGYTIINVRSLLPDKPVNDDLLCRSLSPDEVLNATPDLLAVLYTSGSTGVPKGVQITHRMAMNRVMWQWDRFPFRPDDVGCLKTSLLFVDSIVEMFSCLLNPINFVVCRAGITSNVEEFLGFLQQHRITRLVLVASLLHTIICFLSAPSELERFPLQQLELWISGWNCGSATARRCRCRTRGGSSPRFLATRRSATSTAVPRRWPTSPSTSSPASRMWIENPRTTSCPLAVRSGTRLSTS